MLKRTLALLIIFIMVMAFSENTSPAAAKDALAEKSASGITLSVSPSEAAIAPEAEAEIYIRLRIKAPDIEKKNERPPLNIALVIDKSGSMWDAGKHEYAILAAKEMVRLLNSGDRLGIVVYDDKVKVLSPIAPVKDKEKLNRLLDGVQPGGNTFLSGGLEAGIKEVLKAGGEGVSRVILLSDGLANEGVTSAEEVSRIGASAKDKGVSVSTMGLGRDYDETLMQLLAQRGGGQYNYIRESQDLPAFFREELALASDSVTADLRFTFVPDPTVRDIKVYGYPTEEKNGKIQIVMGNMYAGEERQILVRGKVKPGKASEQSLGKAEMAFTLIGEEKEQSIDLPFAVDVVEDSSARDKKNADSADIITPVRDEGLLLTAEEAHVAAVEAIQRGEEEKAKALMQKAQADLAMASPDNKVIANKKDALAADEEALPELMADRAKQAELAKASKSSFYKSSQGKNTSLLLQEGDKGAMVEKLQRLLADKGLYSGPVDGVYSNELKKAVEAFQNANSLDADGVAGQATMRALGM